MFDDFIQFFSKQPPAWTAWLTIAFVFIRIAFMLKDYFKEKKDAKNSIDDLFWYREVIIPYSLNPIKEFIVSQLNSFSLISDSSAPDDYKAYLDQFKREQGVVIKKVIVTEAVNQNIYPFVQEKLELLEDDIALYCGKKAIGHVSNIDMQKSDVETSFNQVFCEIVKKFRNQHHSLFK